jgi:hypothetical protein
MEHYVAVGVATDNERIDDGRGDWDYKPVVQQVVSERSQPGESKEAFQARMGELEADIRRICDDFSWSFLGVVSDEWSEEVIDATPAMVAYTEEVNRRLREAEERHRRWQAEQDEKRRQREEEERQRKEAAELAEYMRLREKFGKQRKK